MSFPMFFVELLPYVRVSFVSSSQLTELCVTQMKRTVYFKLSNYKTILLFKYPRVLRKKSDIGNQLCWENDKSMCKCLKH